MQERPSTLVSPANMTLNACSCGHTSSLRCLCDSFFESFLAYSLQAAHQASRCVSSKQQQWPAQTLQGMCNTR